MMAAPDLYPPTSAKEDSCSQPPYVNLREDYDQIPVSYMPVSVAGGDKHYNV